MTPRRMSLIACVVVVGLLTQESLRAQAPFDSLRLDWERGDSYDAVLPGLIALQQDSTVDQFKLDYMIGSSLCRSELPGYRSKGVEFYGSVLRRAPGRLVDSAVSVVQRERDECSAALSQGGSMGTPPTVRVISYRQQPRAEVRITGGKEMPDWTFGHCAKVPPLADEPFHVLDTLPDSVLASRLFPRSRRTRAMQLGLARVANSQAGTFVVDTVAHFLLLSSSGPADASLRDVGRYLESYITFYAGQYGMRIPDSLITVYLVPEGGAMRNLARDIHHLTPQSIVIGYSVVSDLSLAAVNNNAPSGTLAHELMHLMLKVNYRDVPPWLDEGMAALYEVSGRQGAVILGRPNWRGALLQKFWVGGKKPGLAELFAMDIKEFERPASGNPVYQALNFAVSRYFVLFVQDRGKLPALYQAMRHRSRIAYGRSGALEIRDDSGPGTAAFVASVLGIPSDKLQGEFEQWMATVLPTGGEPCPQ